MDAPRDSFGVLSPNGEWHQGFTGWNGRDIDPDTGEAYMISVGKKAAGRLLDGHEWNEFPYDRLLRSDVAALYALWPAMPEGIEGEDLFAERYGAPTGVEGLI